MTQALATTAEVAKRLNVKPETLAHWRWETRKGNPRGPRWVPLGRSVRYEWEDVKTWLAEQAERKP